MILTALVYLILVYSVLFFNNKVILLFLFLAGIVYFNHVKTERESTEIYVLQAENDNLRYQIDQCRILHVGE